MEWYGVGKRQKDKTTLAQKSEEYKQKESETEESVEKRLALLNRPMDEGQSPQSNLVGNFDGRYAPQGNTSSVIDSSTASRAQSVAPSKAFDRLTNHTSDVHAVGQSSKRIAKIR